MVEAGVQLARRLRLLRIDLLEVGDHRFGRPVQAVQVEAMDADALRFGEGCVIGVQPLGECLDFAIAPHPGREALVLVERHVQENSGVAEHVAVQLLGIRPIAFDRDRIESLLVDEAPGDLRTHAIELERAMGCLAEQHEPAIAEHLEQSVIVAHAPVEDVGTIAQHGVG